MEEQPRPHLTFFEDDEIIIGGLRKVVGPGR
jgi:hypothetical protein